jgi:hypothetical protein
MRQPLCGSAALHEKLYEQAPFSPLQEKNVLPKKLNPLFLQPQKGNGSVAQLNRASDYGSEGFRFES